MSASLVGSEMCIRDSPEGASPPLKAVLLRTWAPRSQASGASLGPNTTVSYTHLTLPTICSV
eukprot:5962330-Alexandrium_andersonii.AAC.1